MVFVKEDPLERSYLDPEFARGGCRAQLHVAVRVKDEMTRSM
jgi:hypothetical protein